MRLHALAAVGGSRRYSGALFVDALGAGLLRPFMLLYGLRVLGLGLAPTGAALTVGLLVGLAAIPLAGRWIDRSGGRRPVIGALLIRAVGVVVLLAADSLGTFVAAAVLLSCGTQVWPAAHAAVVTALVDGRERDVALSAGRAVRNAGLGVGALIATVTLAGGAGALRGLAVLSGVGFLIAGGLVWGVRVPVLGRVAEGARPVGATAEGSTGTRPARATVDGPAPTGVRPDGESALGPGAESGSASGSGSETGAAGGPGAGRGAGSGAGRGADSGAGRGARGRRAFLVLFLGNLPFALMFDVLEVALPAVFLEQLGSGAAWPGAVFIGNTVLVIALSVPLVVRFAGRSRRSVFGLAGLAFAAAYLGFLGAGSLGGLAGTLGVAACAVVYTVAEILYSGTGTALVIAAAPPGRLGRALARWELSSGLGKAMAPLVLTGLFGMAPAALWVPLAVATGAAGLAVARYGPRDPTDTTEPVSPAGHVVPVEPVGPAEPAGTLVAATGPDPCPGT